jgi:HEAT repeat protein
MHRSGWPLAAAGLLAIAVPLHAQGPQADRPSPSISTPPAIMEVGGKTLSQWMADLKHPDPSVRTQAIMSVVLFGETAQDAVPLIIDRCRDRDASPRVKAVLALGVMAVRDRDIPKVVDTLTRLLSEDRQAIVRYYAASALLRYGEHAQGAVGPLAHLVTEETSNWEIRHMCVAALRHAGRDPKTGPDPRATRALVAAMSDPVEKVRLEAVVGLGAMGRPNDPTVLAVVVRALRAQHNSRDKALALWSHVSLMALDDKVADKSLQAIVKALHSPERDLRVQVLLALAAIGTRARSCVPDVLEAMDDKEPQVVAGACTALGRMGDSGARVTEALIRTTRRKEPSVVWAACQALGELGNANPEVLTAFAQVGQRKELDDLLLQSIERVKENLRKGIKR